VVSEEALQFYIDDALDQIEFIVGPTSSPWGARRAALGHPQPFDLRYVEIGNEDWLKGGPEAWASYIEWRFPRFLEAISAAYPDLQVVSSGAAYDGHDVPEPAIGDYHPYRKPDELVAEFSMFDNAKGHIIGEVAATHVNGGSGWEGSIHPYPWWIGTVAEAVAMIGYERNGDRVPATLYAPVLKHLDRWQWPMTLVAFAADPKLTTRSTSWHLWSLFASAALTHTLPVEGEVGGPLYHVAGRGEGGTLVWKGAVYNTTDGESVDVRVAFEGVREGATARLRTLTVKGGDPWAYNDPYSGEEVVEREERRLVAGEGGWFEFGMEQLSVAVLETRVCKRA
jgi:alpha-N-arabinofuranosidase